MKRLYRITEGRKLCGVCGGMAEYFEIDPSVVRIIWAVATLFCGTGLLAYILCAFILPKKSDIHFDNEQ